MRTGTLLSGFLLSLVTALASGTGCQFGVDTAKGTAPVIAFSLDLYKKISAAKPEENVVFSPVSVALALALVESGADGDTKNSLRRVLAADQNIDPSASYQALQHLLKIQTDEVKLSIANGLFHDREYTLKNEYLTKVTQCFETEVQKVDFTNKEASRQKINSWVSEKTAQKIPSLLQPGVITDRTKVILANAIHLKATWQEAFRRKESMPFYRLGRDNDPQTVSFVLDLDKYMYVDDPNFHTVEIPYAYREIEQRLAMRIILPKQRNGIAAVEQQLTASKFGEFDSKAAQRKIDLRFPRFAIRTPVTLKPILTHLGLASIFANDANFNRMTSGPFHISEAIHQAFIKVNENGTEAAAATAMIMAVGTSGFIGPTEAPIPFIADHPFMFAIVHKPTNVILFMGKVNYVKENEN